MFFFPFFKKRRIEQLETGLFLIEKYLYGFTRSNQILRFFIKKAIAKLNLRCFTWNKTCFDNHRISVTQGFLKGALNIYYRDHKSMFEKIQIANSIPVSKIFPAVFEVSDIMSMPNNAQRICFVEAYQYFRSRD